MGKRSPLRTTDEYQRRICRAIDFICANLPNNPSMMEIARAASFSSFHFQRLFRAVVGESVAEFTRRVRLESAARRLMFRPQEDITRIAIELGFSSSQNFAKAFGRHFGVSPTQYRLRHRGTGFDDARAASAVDGGFQLAMGSRTMKPPVTVKKLPSMRLVYERHLGTYRDAGVERAFDRLMRWAAPRGLDVFANYRGIPWDDADVTPDDRCRFDACLIVPDDARLDGGVNWQTVPAGPYAVLAADVENHDFDLPWTRLLRDWLPDSGYQPADRPRVEVYLTDGSRDPDGRWRIEVCLPVDPL